MASPSFSPDYSDHRRVSLAHIDSIVSARLGPTRGLGKSQPACFNRQVAMYLASHVGRWSTTVIGRFYGGRDHSTVVHGIQRIEGMRETDPNLDVLLSDLKSKIGVTAERMEELPKLRRITNSPATKHSELRLLVNEITAQIRNVLREELLCTQRRDHPDAARSNTPKRDAVISTSLRTTNDCS